MTEMRSYNLVFWVLVFLDPQNLHTSESVQTPFSYFMIKTSIS